MPIEYFDDHGKQLLNSLKIANPDTAESKLAELAASQVRMMASPQAQLYGKFSDRIGILHAEVVLISHALCEAYINTLLSHEFSRASNQQAFELLESANLKQKWLVAPRLVIPEYKADAGQAIFETLAQLVRRRNIYTHFKPAVTINGVVTLAGKILEREPYEGRLRWIHRFISLPFDLVDKCGSQFDGPWRHLYLNSSPIARYLGH